MTRHIASCRVWLLSALLGSHINAHADGSTENTGDILQFLLPLTAYASTFVLDDDTGRTQFYQSFGTNLAITTGLKIAIDKDRPTGNGGLAFPSGHTSTTFQAAAFVHERYGFKQSLLMYLAASYVGWSRVESDKHEPVDVIAGAAIGLLSSFYFTTPKSGVTVAPLTGDGVVGFTITRTW